MEKKSGFLTAVTAKNNAVVYYQCKSCLSFLASTDKWDRHLVKCFSKSGNGIAGRPVGFRMVTFTEPVLKLERVIVSEISSSSDVNLASSPVVKRGRGRPRKTPDTDSNPAQKRGRPRKVLNVTFEESSYETSADSDEESSHETPDSDEEWLSETKKSKRPRKERRESTRKNGTVIRKGRPRKGIPDKVLQQAAKSIPARSAFINAAKKKKERMKKENNTVQSYKFSCPHCPGKFQGSLAFNKHLRSIHSGNPGRKLMTCCVCRREFNKRDSLNQHYLFHEASEAREEKFNLFQPWDDSLLEKVNAYKNFKKNIKYNRQSCKACLLQHYTYHSYVTHFRQEHADPPESYLLDCLWCSSQFKSIRVYLEHAKEAHAQNFFGALTLFRRKRGIYVGNTVRYIKQTDEFGRRMNQTPKPKKKRVKKKKKPVSKPKSPPQKRVSSFMPLPSDDEGSDWEAECGISQRELERSELDEEDDEIGEKSQSLPVKKVEIERIYLDDTNLKQEPNFVNEAAEVERKEEIILPDIFQEDEEQLVIVPTAHESESEPVAFAIIKGEF